MKPIFALFFAPLVYAICDYPNSIGDGDIRIEGPTGTSLAKEQSVSSEDVSARTLSEGASMSLTTSLTTDNVITTSIPSPPKIFVRSTTVSKSATPAESTYTQTKSGNTDAASGQTVASPHTVSARTKMTEVDFLSYILSADQTSALTETETTWMASPSKAASETTTTANSYNEDAVRLATCLYDPNLFGLGETDSDKAWYMIDSLCDRSNDGLMIGDDKCDKTETTYASRVNYLFKICQKEDCLSDGQSLRQPFEENGLSCTDIFYYKIWHWCKFPNLYQNRYVNSFIGNEIIHHGNGGWFDFGCLEYSLRIG